MMAVKGKMTTYGDLLKAAMEIMKQEDADQMLLTIVDRCAKESGKSRSECVKIQRYNLGYFAGYYDNETRERVERLFKCQHPVFGASIRCSEQSQPKERLRQKKLLKWERKLANQ